MKNSELRKEAREKLKGKWGNAVGISIISSIIYSLLVYISSTHAAFQIFIPIIFVPLSYAITLSYKKIINDENIEILDFIPDTFRNFEKAWVIKFRIFLKLLIPIIIISIVLLISLFTLVIGIFQLGLSSGNIITTILIYIGILILTLPLNIWYLIKKLLYTITYELGTIEPKLSPKELVEQSEKLMKGNRCKYIGLILSFLGWSFLSILSLGIGFIWLKPYMEATSLCFAQDLLNNSTENINIDNKNN